MHVTLWGAQSAAIKKPALDSAAQFEAQQFPSCQHAVVPCSCTCIKQLTDAMRTSRRFRGRSTQQTSNGSPVFVTTVWHAHHCWKSLMP